MGEVRVTYATGYDEVLSDRHTSNIEEVYQTFEQTFDETMYLEWNRFMKRQDEESMTEERLAELIAKMEAVPLSKTGAKLEKVQYAKDDKLNARLQKAFDKAKKWWIAEKKEEMEYYVKQNKEFEADLLKTKDEEHELLSLQEVSTSALLKELMSRGDHE